MEGCKVLFQCIKAQTCSHPPILTSGRSHFYTCWCGAKGSSDQKPTSSAGVGLGAGDWCTGQAVGFGWFPSKGRQGSGRSCLLICLSGERRSALVRLSDPLCCEFPEDQREWWPLPGDSAGWPSFPLHFGLEVDKKSYFSTRFLFPSCFLLPRQVVWTSIFLAEGSFITHLFIAFSTQYFIQQTARFYSTFCQV